MHHPIKLTSLSVFVAAAVLVAGCGDSKAEKAAKEKERQRIELENQAMRDVQKSNKAVSDISKKIGRKVEPIDLGVTAEKKTETNTPAAPPKP
jgi:hypothetical protein